MSAEVTWNLLLVISLLTTVVRYNSRPLLLAQNQQKVEVIPTKAEW